MDKIWARAKELLPKYANGNWIVTTIKSQGAGDYLGVISTSAWGQEMVASCSNGTQEKMEANAKLIAAAPELLRALQDMIEVNGMEVTDENVKFISEKHNAAKAIIQKATA